ncbi:ESCRT-III subunit protein snf7 [Friedmanniomyces endolithicus]|nr:ESCRT-III subunit protein snf7 [Friedmanniomyces endolithicus]KAK0967966.1 ESCRT-III subunit protein snf7 [Friedmanniomyces endolithicus]
MLTDTHDAVAKAALQRKKPYEHQLELTSAQMLTIEREVSSIETANLNKESFNAIKQAQQAMKTIHGGLTIDKVDWTMEDLRELHAKRCRRGRAHVTKTQPAVLQSTDPPLQYNESLMQQIQQLAKIQETLHVASATSHRIALTLI